MSRKFITAGSVIIDYIIPYGHETRPGIRRGGGAMYSAQGLRLWEDSVAVAAYSGKDFGGWYGSWLSENGIDSTGVVKKYVKTRQTNLIYNAEGTFSCIGRGDEEYVEHPSVIDRELIEPLIGSETVGVHILAAPEPEIVLPISDLCRQRGIRFGMEFEVARLYGRSDNHELFMELSSYTDYFSINLYEAKRLFPGVRDEKDALEELRSYGVPCYFRLGTDGALFIGKDRVIRAPMISRFGNVDATGCGNSSTSAVFWAICNGYSPEECAYIGGVTASVNAGCEGLVPRLTPELRSQCDSLVHEYVQKHQPSSEKQ